MIEGKYVVCLFDRFSYYAAIAQTYCGIAAIATNPPRNWQSCEILNSLPIGITGY